MDSYLKPEFEFNDEEKEIFNKLYDDLKKASIPQVVKFLNKNTDRIYITLDNVRFDEMCLWVIRNRGGYDFYKFYSKLDMNGCYTDGGYYDTINTYFLARDIIIENIKNLDELDMSDLYSVEFEFA